MFSKLCFFSDQNDCYGGIFQILVTNFLPDGLRWQVLVDVSGVHGLVDKEVVLIRELNQRLLYAWSLAW